MTSTLQRGKGRPSRPYEASWNEHVNGLRRRKDGRWVVVATGKVFTEPNERLAVARFLRMSAGNRVELVGTVADLPHLPAPAVCPTTPEQCSEELRALVDAHFANGNHEHIRINTDKPLALASVTTTVPEPLLWAWFREQLLTRPKYCAEMTGVEQLGYLLDLKKPGILPTFTELETLWKENSKTKSDEVRRVLADWKNFVDVSGCTDLRAITVERCIAYRKTTHARNLSGKRQHHLFNHARRVLSFAKLQELPTGTVEAIDRALAAMRLMFPSDTSVSLNPDPIEPEDFKKLLEASTGDDRAMLLLLLNCALHIQECMDLTWDHIKGGYLIAHRRKKGKFLRISVLWPETLEALAQVKRREGCGSIFYSKTSGEPLTVYGASKRFRELRVAAGCAAIESDQIRDGAATQAAIAGVNDQLFNLMMGHRNPGMKDNYAKRNPQIVAPACAATYAAYFPKPKKQKTKSK